MIINLSLITIWLCLAFIVSSKNIDVGKLEKFTMCLMMLSTIAAYVSLNTSFKNFYIPSWDAFFSCLALVACVLTYRANKRGNI